MDGAAYEPRRIGERLPRSWRIVRSWELRRLVRRGKRSGTAHVDVFLAASPEAHPRVGLVVPRHRHGITARNLLKRRLREILRREVVPRLHRANASLDVLIRARPAAYEADFQTLRTELVRWMEVECSRASSSR